MADVNQWVEKAEDDLLGAAALARLRKKPLPDVVCFHCQQCAEKYLKAFLAHHGEDPPKIHDLLELLDSCVEKDPLLAALAGELLAINSYAVSARYPGASSTVAEAREALARARTVRRVLRKTLGL